MLPNSSDYTFLFTHVELYGGAHLALGGNGTKLQTEFMYGDDTGHLHIGPGQTFELTEVYKSFTNAYQRHVES